MRSSALLLAALMLGGQQDRTIRIVASDFSFAAPDTIEGGNVVFDFVNRGTEPHEAILRRVLPGHTGAEAVAAFSNGSETEGWFEGTGGPNVIAPGEHGVVAQSLQPGTYIWICYISSADRTPHHRKGMVRMMTVRGSAAQESEPVSKVTLRMHDFAYTLSDPLHPGKQWIRIENVGAKRHEVVIWRLDSGKNLSDALAWRRVSGEPRPYAQSGGIAAIAPGSHAFIQLDVRPGSYVFRCRIVDDEAHKTHFELGMQNQFDVGSEQ